MVTINQRRGDFERHAGYLLWFGVATLLAGAAIVPGGWMWFSQREEPV